MPMYSPFQYNQAMYGYPPMQTVVKDEDVGGMYRGRPAEYEEASFANLDLVRTKVRTEFYPFLNE